MEPKNIPFNALIVGPTNCGKSQFVVNQLCGPFRGKFDYVVLICPTLLLNKTYFNFAPNDPCFFLIDCRNDQVDRCLKHIFTLFEGTNTLIILDDCAFSNDVKSRSGELVKLAFSGRHAGFSTWVISQKLTAITASFRSNAAAVVVFYTQSEVELKAIFGDYGARLDAKKRKEIIKEMFEKKFSYLIFSQRHPFEIKLNSKKIVL